MRYREKSRRNEQIVRCSPIFLIALALGGCGQQSTKFYTCEGERRSYRNDFDYRIFKFDDFSVVLKKKISLAAQISGEAMYQIEGNVFPVMTATSHRYRLFVQDEKTDTQFSFSLISKKFLFSTPNSFRHTDFYDGRCVLSEI